MDETIHLEETLKLEAAPRQLKVVSAEHPIFAKSIPETPMPSTQISVESYFPALPDAVRPVQVPQKQITPTPSRIPDKDLASARLLRERCRQLYLSVFFRDVAPVRSLGFTSALGGEGKSFLSAVTARALAEDAISPVILLECNWEHPTLHEYFGIASTPGLAEWLRGECSETAIRHDVGDNLTVIPAGNGRRDAVRLLQQFRKMGLLDTLARSDELLIVDLPAIAVTGYAVLAANLVESLLVVVRAGVTPDTLIKATSSQLKDFPVQGMILNQVESHVPRWIRQLL